MGELIGEILPGLSPGLALLAVLAVFGAAFLRGFTGFGFALAAVPSLSLLLDPSLVVPCSLVLGLFAGIQVLPKLWSLVDWRSVWLLLVGSLPGIPVGVWLLSAVPADIMRIGIGCVLIGAVLLLWRMPRGLQLPVTPFALGAGLLSGLLNGSTAMGGPPVVLYFLGASESVVIGRASLVMYFFFASLGTVLYDVGAGLIDRRVLMLSLLFFPALYVGNWLGDRSFDASSAETYRRIALGALLGLAVLAVIRAVAL
ncbi:MAG: uncharacterized protein QOK29_657 [Rhodospirillaceae bacterium]|nr:uncharacterized protein [Rhodospirillaceae bacterium]